MSGDKYRVNSSLLFPILTPPLRRRRVITKHTRPKHYFRLWLQRVHEQTRFELSQSSIKIYQTLAAGNLAMSLETMQRRKMVLSWMNISLNKAFKVRMNKYEDIDEPRTHHRNPFRHLLFSQRRFGGPRFSTITDTGSLRSRGTCTSTCTSRESTFPPGTALFSRGGPDAYHWGVG